MNETTSHKKNTGKRPSTAEFVKSKQKYRQLPSLRRQDVCSSILVIHLIALFAAGYIPRLFPVTIATTIGVLIVCISVLTGPVYMNQLDFKTGELMQWGTGNKIAAIIVLALSVGGFAFVTYRILIAFL